MDIAKALAHAYSSTLRIEQRDGKTVMIKSVHAQERRNEIAFHKVLHQLGMPSMEMYEKHADLVISFLEDAEGEFKPHSTTLESLR